MSEVVRIRLTASSLEAAETAVTKLLDGAPSSTFLEFRSPRQGRRGEWLVYGRLTVDAAKS